MHLNGWFSANPLEHDEQIQMEHPILKSGRKKNKKKKKHSSYGIIQVCVPKFSVYRTMNVSKCTDASEQIPLDHCDQMLTEHDNTKDFFMCRSP